MYTKRKEGGMGMVDMDQVYKKEFIGIGGYLKVQQRHSFSGFACMKETNLIQPSS